MNELAIEKYRALKEKAILTRVYGHFSKMGYVHDLGTGLIAPQHSKDQIRLLHGIQKDYLLGGNSKFISVNLPKLLPYFASGKDIDPLKINPRLELVKSHTWQASLFKMASLTWSVPVSRGYGRRMRFLVWDQHNEKLIGIFALGDPVFNLAVRDGYIGWSGEERKQRLVNIMDAFVLGSVPPYNILLGGKLVGCLPRSLEVYQEFNRKYNNSTGILSKENKKANLIAVTTSSSLGRSSIYNRLKLDSDHYFKSLGYTRGWGHFHIPDPIFFELRSYLRELGHSYADSHSFEDGSNWRLRNIRAAFSKLGITDDLLRHGVRREVFISELATNAISILKDGADALPDIRKLRNISEIGQLALERWIIPRSRARDDYKSWTLSDLASLFFRETL